jgi:hypothetical protein
VTTKNQQDNFILAGHLAHYMDIGKLNIIPSQPIDEANLTTGSLN